MILRQTLVESWHKRIIGKHGTKTELTQTKKKKKKGERPRRKEEQKEEGSFFLVSIGLSFAAKKKKIGNRQQAREFKK